MSLAHRRCNRVALEASPRASRLELHFRKTLGNVASRREHCRNHRAGSARSGYRAHSGSAPSAPPQDGIEAIIGERLFERYGRAGMFNVSATRRRTVSRSPPDDGRDCATAPHAGRGFSNDDLLPEPLSSSPEQRARRDRTLEAPTARHRARATAFRNPHSASLKRHQPSSSPNVTCVNSVAWLVSLSSSTPPRASVSRT